MFPGRTALAFVAAWSGVAFGPAARASAEDLFKSLPPGVYLQSRGEVPADQRMAIGRKLGGGIREITNSILRVHGRSIQVNVITAESGAAAEAIYEAFLRIKAPPFCIRKDETVVEYVGSDIDAALAVKTSYELKLIPKPDRVRYRLKVNLATIDREDYMASNPLFNQFLALRDGDKPEIVAEIDSLSKRFQFGRTLVLRNPNLGQPASFYQFKTTPASSAEMVSTTHYLFPELPLRYGVPSVDATLEISVNSDGLTPDAIPPEPRLTAASSHWPVGDPKIQALTGEITSGKTTDEDRVAAILEWLTPGKNLRYTGEIGSRWGTLRVLEQKFGQCWDFSDCFVTLCRAAGIPARQVAGWLYGSSGHVWAEYYREGRGWQQVDPTGGGQPCGIYHIPYFTSEDGEMPILYLSMPIIEVEGDGK